MNDVTDREIKAAMRRGLRAGAEEPRAGAVRYDRKQRRLVIDLTNGCTVLLPPERIQGLESATPEQLEQVEVLGVGYGLHWEPLDVDVSVPGLLNGVFGTRSHMARLAGRSTSPAKAAAARANGRKGGRPAHKPAPA